MKTEKLLKKAMYNISKKGILKSLKKNESKNKNPKKESFTNGLTS